MRRPLVSVITPTWQRLDEVLEAIENVRAQTYRPLEHVVVSDGLDYDLGSYHDDGYLQELAGDVMLHHVQLGRNWSTYLPDSFCAAPTTVAMLVARGDYQMWLADDERMTPDHIATLVDAVERSGAGFAYSRVEMYRAEAPHARWIIGTDPPVCGQITNVLYRAEVLKLGLYVVGDQFTSDWATIERWMKGGATWAFVDRVTLTHRADR